MPPIPTSNDVDESDRHLNLEEVSHSPEQVPSITQLQPENKLKKKHTVHFNNKSVLPDIVNGDTKIVKETDGLTMQKVDDSESINKSIKNDDFLHSHPQNNTALINNTEIPKTDPSNVPLSPIIKEPTMVKDNKIRTIGELKKPHFHRSSSFHQDPSWSIKKERSTTGITDEELPYLLAIDKAEIEAYELEQKKVTHKIFYFEISFK